MSVEKGSFEVDDSWRDGGPWSGFDWGQALAHVPKEQREAYLDSVVEKYNKSQVGTGDMEAAKIWLVKHGKQTEAENAQTVAWYAAAMISSIYHWHITRSN